MKPAENQRSLPVFMIGFILLMLLPVLIAFFDVTLGPFISYDTRLIIWNQPWLYAAGFASAMAWASARQTHGRFVELGAQDIGMIGFLLVLSLALSRLVSANPEIADMHLRRLGLGILLGISAYYSMKTDPQRFSQAIYRTFIVSAVCVAAVLLFFIYVQPTSRDLGWYIVWFLPGFGPLRLFGIFYEVAILLSIGMILTARTRSSVLLLSVTLVILWAVLFWSGGRGALLSLTLSIALGALFYRKQAAKMWLLFLGSGFLGALLSLLLWVPDHTSFGILNLLQTATREGANAFSSGRLERWMAATGLIGAHPLYGYGLNQFSNLWSSYITMDETQGITGAISPYFLSYRHVHNIVFEAFLAWGVIGGAVFLLLLFKTWFKAAKRVLAALPAERMPAFLALNALLFHSNFTGVYIFPHSVFYMAIFFGICLAPKPAQNGNTNG